MTRNRAISLLSPRSLVLTALIAVAVSIANGIALSGPAAAASAVGAREGETKIKLPNPPQWRSGSISRSEDGQLLVETSTRSLRQVDPERFAFLKDYRTSSGSACTALKRPANLDARAPAHVKSIVHKLAPQYDLDPRLVLAVIAVESNFHDAAVSPKNAQGLMQLIPGTAKRFGVRDPFNAAENIRGGMQYLRWLLRTFNGDLALALAGYNAGEKAVQKYRGVPPYNETQEYVKKVHALYGCDRVYPGNGGLTTAAGTPAGQAKADGGWPAVREPYDVWNAATSSIERNDNGRCRFRIGRDHDRWASNAAGTLICR